MRTADLTAAETLKFRLLSRGLAISNAARSYIDERNRDRAMTPADYASTSGLILELDDDVWVNAPISRFNANFVVDTPYRLDFDRDHLLVHGDGLVARASMWIPPAYHDQVNEWGERYDSYAYTHGDRVRISPIEGCSMTCKFCNLPYDFRYRTRRIEGLVDAVKSALADPVQPAHHVLISGGTPRSRDVGHVRSTYESVIRAFSDIPVDIMMVPRDDLLDPEWLDRIGVGELSVNLEVYNRDLAHSLMRQKASQGRDHYLDYLERASTVLGGHRVRSMLMVGLEPLEDTLAGVEAIARRGAVPVLSPFRPDPATPLRDRAPIDADRMEDVYFRARDITDRYDVPLGPRCIPCGHNTISLAASGNGTASVAFGRPYVI